MKKETFTCDICGVEKKETNHWFRSHQSVKIGRSYFTVTNWDYSWMDSNTKGDKDLCGEECVGKALSIYMGELKKMGEKGPTHAQSISDTGDPWQTENFERRGLK